MFRLTLRLGLMIVLMMLVIFSASLVEPAFAARQKKEKKVKKKEVIKPAVVEVEKKQTLLKEKQEKLNNTIWQVRFIRIGEEKKKESFEDELEFIDHKFTSKKMLKEGFSATNITFNLKGENIVIWETMQTGPNNDLVFWKGEIESEVMRGVLSLQPQTGEVKDYSFVSISKEIITKEKAQKIEEQSQEGLEEKPTELKKEEKKKKWFW